MRKGHHRIIIAFIILIIGFLPYLLTGCKKTDRTIAGQSESGPPPAPNVAYGVKIKKDFGNVHLQIDAGVVSPYKKFPQSNVFQFMLEKGYKIKLTNLKINISDNNKSMDIKAGTAFSNEEFTRLRIRGIMEMKQKGFKIKRDAKNIDLSIKDGKIIIESVM